MDGVQAKADWLRDQRERRGWSAAHLASLIREEASRRQDHISLSQQAVSNFENGQTKSLPRWVALAEFIISGEAPQKVPEPAVMAEHLDLVPITEIDLAYGLGATFTDQQIEVTIHHFPRIWVESISNGPPALLTIARGRGDSMEPTISDGDMVIINRAERTVREQDALWALTIGDIGMIKRVRIRGERVILLSDNDRVPPDEAHVSEVNIVGRIDFVGSRK